MIELDQIGQSLSTVKS